ncbi:TniB family NTP-binding protein [Rhizobium sp. CFBP 13726]|uniref:TniB family NTP-binding protein n=1 Tax=Rhizobium sp. CFBP 13726 TaxID=2775296 RepID=UPI00177FCDC6|nr:TniB family NTP-binding protein [Rhizobium sp. CFBP 13726]MBD8651165.1 TniB family NTP-binding protein [Rhizobium sp. CFBP 13726]
MDNAFTKHQFKSSAQAIYDRMSPELKRRAETIGRLHSYYYETAFDERFEVYFEEMMTNVVAQLFGGSGKQRVMFVIGNSNSGKTSLVQHHLQKREELKSFHNDVGEEVSPILRFDAPSKPTGKGLALAGLAALDYDVVAKSMNEYELYDLLVKQMIENGKVIAHIDEMQQIVSAKNDDKIQSVADIIKLMAQVQDYPIHLIFSGLPSIANFLGARRDLPNRDQQLSNRSHGVVELPILNSNSTEDKNAVREALVGIAAVADLRLGKDVDDDLLQRTMHAASYAFGSVLELVKKTFINAATYGDSVVTKGNFAAAYSQWRGCLPEENIFLADDDMWIHIHPENSVSHLLADTDSAQSEKSPGSNTTRRGSTKKKDKGVV